MWERYTSSFIASRRYFGDQNLPPEVGRTPSRFDEVIPEADASFSDKFKNRVDYAVSKEGVPVIAVEAKKAVASRRPTGAN